MDRLPPRQRTIIEMVCGEDLTTPEIAERLALSPHSVKNHRAAIMLRFGVASMQRVCALYGMHQERVAGADIRAALGDGRAMRAEQV